MMDFIALLLIFCIGFYLGRIYGFYTITKIMRDIAEDQGIDVQAELDALKHEDTSGPVVYKLEVEKHGEFLYLFDVESENFVCQGQTVQELAQTAKTYKNILYAAVKHDDKIFRFADGESTEVV